MIPSSEKYFFPFLLRLFFPSIWPISPPPPFSRETDGNEPVPSFQSSSIKKRKAYGKGRKDKEEEDQFKVAE